MLSDNEHCRSDRTQTAVTVFTLQLHILELGEHISNMFLQQSTLHVIYICICRRGCCRLVGEGILLLTLYFIGRGWNKRVVGRPITRFKPPVKCVADRSKAVTPSSPYLVSVICLCLSIFVF